MVSYNVENIPYLQTKLGCSLKYVVVLLDTMKQPYYILISLTNTQRLYQKTIFYPFRAAFAVLSDFFFLFKAPSNTDVSSPVSSNTGRGEVHEKEQ